MKQTIKLSKSIFLNIILYLLISISLSFFPIFMVGALEKVDNILLNKYYMYSLLFFTSFFSIMLTIFIIFKNKTLKEPKEYTKYNIINYILIILTYIIEIIIIYFKKTYFQKLLYLLIPLCIFELLLYYFYIHKRFNYPYSKLKKLFIILTIISIIAILYSYGIVIK